MAIMSNYNNSELVKMFTMILIKVWHALALVSWIIIFLSLISSVGVKKLFM